MISLPDPARILIKLLGWSLRAPASWRSTSVSTTGTGFNDGLLDRMRPWMTMDDHGDVTIFAARNLQGPQVSQSSCDRRVFKKLTKAPSGWMMLNVCDIWCWLAAPGLFCHLKFIEFLLLRASMRLSPESWRRRRPAPRAKLSKRFERSLLKISNSR